MKKIVLASWCLSFLIFVLVSVVHANQRYYTFVGSIGAVEDVPGILADQGIGIGDEITFTILLDFDAQGTNTLNNGAVIPVSDYFYADYISGTNIEPRDGGCYNDPEDVAEMNQAWDEVLGTGEYRSNVYVGSANLIIHFYRENSPLPLEDWVEGTAIQVIIHVYDSECQRSALTANGSFVTISPPEPPPSPALVGYWKFDESNGSIAIDSSVFGNHGIIRGATRTIGQCQNALNFDGGADGLDYVVVPNSNSINTNTFTVSFWASLSDLDRHHVLLDKRNGQWHHNYEVSYYADDSAPGVPLGDYLYVGIGDGSRADTSYSYAAYAAVNLVEGQLYHIAATYDLSVLRLYLNGEEIATKDLTMTNTTGDGDLYIGAHPYHGALYATDGVIDEVRIYNYALTPEQIQADMQCPPVPHISGCIEVNGIPLVNKELILKQQGGPNLTTTTDMDGCYEFEEAVTGDKIKFEVEGPMSY